MKLPWEMFFLKSIQAISVGLANSSSLLLLWLACKLGQSFSLVSLRQEVGTARPEAPLGSSSLQPVVPLGWGLDVSKAPKAWVRYEHKSTHHSRMCNYMLR